MSALIALLSGASFRLFFGAIMEWLNKEQDHKHELELTKLQQELDASRHARDMERIKLQSDLGVTEVKVVADAVEQKAMTDAFLTAVKATTIQTGIKWVDAWNQSIRPAGATVSLVLWVVSMGVVGFALNEFDKELIAAFLGIFIGERIHRRMK